VVRFGGRTGNNDSQTTHTTPLNSTWELSRLGWRRFTTGNPSPVLGPAMTYDSRRNEIVLFGGATATAGSPVPLDTMWIRSGTAWSQVVKTGDWPAARQDHAMAYDRERGEVVMYGGLQGDEDTWTWNGAAWTKHHFIQPNSGPRISPRAPLSWAAMSYDPIRRLTVLFGGGLDAFLNSYAETWVWDGVNWTNLTSTLAASPPPRSGGTFTWDPARRSLILVQQFEPLGVSVSGPFLDTWELELAATTPVSGTWRRVPTLVTPPQHAFAGTFTTPDGSGISMMYGYGFLGYVQSDLWQLRFDATPVIDSCRNPYDADGDGLTGCAPATADPDCWVVCNPECGPGDTCAAGSSQCGDGSCSAIETCYSCPQDCTACVPRCGDFICDAGEACAGDCP
jgi:hypothetical protein